MDPASLRAAGWTPLDLEGFTGQLGPLWSRGKGAERDVGFIAEPRHRNEHMHTVHGGALMTFADVALGWGVVDALGGSHCATVQLQLQFISPPKIGAFITCRPELIRRSTQLVFMRGLLSSGEKTVASAEGIWKILEKKAGA